MKESTQQSDCPFKTKPLQFQLFLDAQNCDKLDVSSTESVHDVRSLSW